MKAQSEPGGKLAVSSSVMWPVEGGLHAAA
jgi:hypothetical protein